MDENQGLIFNIVRGSFVDGHGIRTTVFLKGCPLKCLWCCNVEGQEVYPELKVTPSECDGCGRCVDLCPAKAIRLNLDGGEEGEILQVNRELCTDCVQCVEACTRGALQRFGEYYTVDGLFDIIRKDERTYRTSGGGVTIAGGEPTFWPQFTYALLKKCRDNYIHTALDTCGYTLTDLGFECLEEADLLLFDLKHMDSHEHERLTGVPNELILANLKKLNDSGKDIIIRMPIIPGYNDSAANIRASAEFLSGLKSVERLDLIGYHNYSGKKYMQLGREYPLTMPAAEEPYMEGIKGLFEQYGLNVQLGG
jgi:pyruvate formate lyase activating enzyme